MDAQKRKLARALRRRHRVRKAIRGTAAKPRLSVYRSNKHIFAQLIDDERAVTIAAASSASKGNKLPYGGNTKAAAEVGTRIAELAKAQGITQAAFDRGSYRFHGRVKALAIAATKAGLHCTSLEEATKVRKSAEAPTPTAKDKKPAGEKKAGGEAKAKEPKAAKPAAS